MRRVTLRLRTAHSDETYPTRCGEDKPLTAEEEDNVIDQLLGPPPEEGEEDVMELTTAAVLEEKDGRLCLRYRETELSGMEGCTTEISFALAEPSLVSVQRSGEIRTALILEAGRYHNGLYETPYMPLEVSTRTYRLKNGLSMAGGSLYVDYLVRIGGISTIRTRLTAEILN